MTVRHHYVAVGGRLVHYVRAGQGPAAVLVHASPGDWRGLRALVDDLARHSTVFALDTPGHGWSDPLPAATPGIADYGAALLATMDALRLGPAHLYGTHTGAKIALNAAVARPDRVASLVLDGLGVATPAERADQLAHYTPDHAPRSDGGHLVAAWHQVRDMFRFWPWYAQSAASRLPGPEPDPADLHVLVHGLLLAGPRYPLAYRAAFAHDPLDELSRLATPTLLLATPDDPLHAQLGRIGPLPSNIRLAVGAGAVAQRTATHIAVHLALAVHGRSAVPASDPPAATTQRRCFVPTTIGDVHVTCPGGPAHEVIVAPLAAYADDTVATGTAVIEVPGSGRSTLQPGATPTVGALAEAVADSCAALDLHPTLLRGCGSTTAIAADLATRVGAAARVTGRPDPRLPRLLPGLRPRADGTHLLTAWHLVRDAAIRRLSQAGRWPGVSGDRPDLTLLQSRTVALTGCWDTLPAVWAACADTPLPQVRHASDFPLWDPFSGDAQ